MIKKKTLKAGLHWSAHGTTKTISVGVNSSSTPAPVVPIRLQEKAQASKHSKHSNPL